MLIWILIDVYTLELLYIERESNDLIGDVAHVIVSNTVMLACQIKQLQHHSQGIIELHLPDHLLCVDMYTQKNDLLSNCKHDMIL